jgi:hypothetical protein
MRGTSSDMSRWASSRPSDLDLLIIFGLRAIQDARVGAAEADQRPDHLWIMERECPCHEASPILADLADKHEAVVSEVPDEGA